MHRPAVLLTALVLGVAATACDHSPETTPSFVESVESVEAVGVSARHAFDVDRAPDGLAVRASDRTATLMWRTAGQWVGVDSSDGGRSFAPPVARPAAGVAARGTLSLAAARLDDERWRLSGQGELRAHHVWTVALPRLAAGLAPVAVDEYRGLVAVVTPDHAQAGVVLTLRRYLPPLRRGPGAGTPIGLPLELGRLRALPRGPVVTALAEAALVAWVEPTRVTAVRVALPDAFCGRLTWQPLPEARAATGARRRPFHARLHDDDPNAHPARPVHGPRDRRGC